MFDWEQTPWSPANGEMLSDNSHRHMSPGPGLKALNLSELTKSGYNQNICAKLGITVIMINIKLLCIFNIYFHFIDRINFTETI